MMTLLLWARFGFLVLFGAVVTLYAWTAYHTREERWRD
jgi:hypothetical protein